MERPVTEYPQPGEKRIYTSFDVSVQLPCQTSFNLLFKDKEVKNRRRGRGRRGKKRKKGGRGEGERGEWGRGSKRKRHTGR